MDPQTDLNPADMPSGTGGILGLVRNLVTSETLPVLADRTLEYFEQANAGFDPPEDLVQLVVFQKPQGNRFHVYKARGDGAEQFEDEEFQPGDWADGLWEAVNQQRDVFSHRLDSNWMGPETLEGGKYFLQSVPFQAGGRTLGFYLLLSRQHFESSDTFAFLGERFGTVIGEVIRFKQNAWKVEDRLETFQRIDRFYQKINKPQDLDETLSFCLDTFQQLFNAPDGSVMIYDRSDRVLRVTHTTATTSGEPLELKLGEGVAGGALERDEIVAITDVSQSTEFKNYGPDLEQTSPKSLLCIPLTTPRRKVGVVNLSDHQRVRPFNPEDVPGVQLLQSRIAAALDSLLMKETLKEVARTDELTGVYNRRHVGERLEQMFERYRTYQRPFGVILLDLDDFKAINDRWGHQVGDQVLKAFATELSEQAKNSEFVGRFGGDEFIYVLPDTPRDAAKKRVRQLARRIEGIEVEVEDEDDSSLHPTASLGLSVAQPGDDLSNVEQLLNRADKLMYDAKEDRGVKFKTE